jgi:hypothetical protein
MKKKINNLLRFCNSFFDKKIQLTTEKTIGV